MFSISRTLIFILIFCTLTAQANLSIPRNLTQAERKKVTEILGLSSSVKVLGDPYPMGGYSGVEIGYAYEVVPAKEISNLGSMNGGDGETNYSLITIAKGLYNNLDVMGQFSPFSQAEGVANYGGQIRWSFFQARSLPLYMSLVSSINSVNFQDKISMLSQGNDLVAGFTAKDITLYMGVGVTRSIATFMGGETCTNAVPPVCTKNAESITDSGKTVKEDISESHYLAGVNLKIDRVFLAMQMDRYTQSVFSAKLGYRF